MAAAVVQALDDGEGGRNGYRVPAVEKALDVLEFMFELAHQHPPVNRLVECALPLMRELAASVDQSCHLVVREAANALVVLQIDSPLPMRYSVALGSHFPILETSSGAVLLAHSNAAERDRIVERIVAAGEGQGTRAEIDARLNDVARLGYEMRASLAVEACTNISMPVRDHTGAAIAALTVPFLPQKAARFDRKTVLERTRAAAEKISAALGAGEAAALSRTDPERRDDPFNNA
jgi:DNA-binding IclR family transcriptional regulator